MIKSTLRIATLSAAVISSFQFAQANQCTGQLYGINAGRGDTALVFKLNEFTQNTQAHSRAKFSSSALAYVPELNRLYYVAVPRPIEYEVDVSHLDFNDTELQSLPIHGSRHKYIDLAYVDLSTNEHVEVGRTKNMYRLTYDTQNNRLLGSYKDELYAIDPHTAETQTLGTVAGLDKGLWRGDLVFKNNELLLVSSTSIYKINTSAMTATKLSDHNLAPVTGASLNQQGDLILSRALVSDLGHSNNSALYKVNENTGNTCHIADLPVRINDLATSNEAVSCYSTPVCSVNDIPSLSLSAVEGSVTEGESLIYTLSLSNTYDSDSEISVTTTAGTAKPGDYTYADQTVVIPAGDLSTQITIPTTDDDVYNETKTLIVNAQGTLNATGTVSSPGAILNDDVQCVPQQFTRIYYDFVSEKSAYNNDWGIIKNNSFVKLLDEYGATGFFDVNQGQSVTYALAPNGNAQKFVTTYKTIGEAQYWEDKGGDNDYNDFVVLLNELPMEKGCN